MHGVDWRELGPVRAWHGVYGLVFGDSVFAFQLHRPSNHLADVLSLFGSILPKAAAPVEFRESCHQRHVVA